MAKNVRAARVKRDPGSPWSRREAKKLADAASLLPTIEPLFDAREGIDLLNKFQTEKLATVRFAFLLLAMNGGQLVNILRDANDEEAENICQCVTDAQKMMQGFGEDLKKAETRIFIAAAYLENLKITGAGALAAAASKIVEPVEA